MATKPLTQAPPNPFVANDNARRRVLADAMEMEQPIFTKTLDPAKDPSFVVTPRNVGLIKRFLAVLTLTLENTGATDATLSDFGLANILEKVSFVDLNNNERINTSGWHLANVAAAKYQWPLGSVLLPQAESSDYGDNFAVIFAPATIAAGESKTIGMVYEVPLAYSDEDLRGAIYASVVNAQMQLTLTVNSKPFAAVGKDSTFAIYKGSTGVISSATCEVTQYYLDQLPTDGKGVILPQLDLATVYELKNTTLASLTEGQEFPIAYANMRDFLSTFVLYNHDASADAGRVGGTDIDYFTLTSANLTNIQKKSPRVAALNVRKLLQTDCPKGLYYFPSRRKPISTTTYGNMELIMKPKTAAASAYVNVGWEMFAITNTLKTEAGSLAS